MTDKDLEQSIGLLPAVKFKHIPRAFLVLIDAMLSAEDEFGMEAYVTGAAFEGYPENGLHDQGFAWDIRIHNVVDRVGYVSFLYTRLKSVSENFRFLYGDEFHTDHIHIEYRLVEPE